MLPRGLRVSVAALAVALLLHATTALSQTDSTRTSRPAPFTRRDALLAGAFALGTVAFAPLDKLVARTLQDTSAFNDPLVRLLSINVSYVGRPGVLIASSSVFLIGKASGKINIADVGLHTTEAIMVGEATNAVLKSVAGRARPRAGIDRPFDFGFGRGFRDAQYRSFASSHATSSFAFAAALTEESARRYRHTRWCITRHSCLPPAWYIGAVTYGAAGLIGLTRTYNNEHWASDVMMGAAIGTFAGLKIVQYHHARPGNRLDRWLLSATVSVGARGEALLGASMPTSF